MQKQELLRENTEQLQKIESSRTVQKAQWAAKLKANENMQPSDKKLEVNGTPNLKMGSKDEKSKGIKMELKEKASAKVYTRHSEVGHLTSKNKSNVMKRKLST
jgi:hypothetical protein